MQTLFFLATVASFVSAQFDSVNVGEFIDPVTKIRFVNATVDRFQIAIALPAREWTLDFIGRISGHEIGWGGIALGPGMTKYALIAGMPDLQTTQGVLLYTSTKRMPPSLLVPGVEIWPIHTYADRADWSFTFLCKNCLRFAAFNQSMNTWEMGLAWDKISPTIGRKHSNAVVISMNGMLAARDVRYDEWKAKAARKIGGVYMGLPEEGNVPKDAPQQTLPPPGKLPILPLGTVLGQPAAAAHPTARTVTMMGPPPSTVPTMMSGMPLGQQQQMQHGHGNGPNPPRPGPPQQQQQAPSGNGPWGFNQPTSSPQQQPWNGPSVAPPAPLQPAPQPQQQQPQQQQPQQQQPPKQTQLPWLQSSWPTTAHAPYPNPPPPPSPGIFVPPGQGISQAESDPMAEPVVELSEQSSVEPQQQEEVAQIPWSEVALPVQAVEESVPREDN
jgi:Cytochrome domain of cellobiose dehydrogenase